MARRVLIFSIGFLFGSILVYQLLIKDTDREFYGSWLPEGRVLKKIKTSLNFGESRLNCLMECQDVFASDIEWLLENGDVDFSKSETKAKRKSYRVEGETEGQMNLAITFELLNDSVWVSDLVSDKQKTCDCN